MKAIPRVVLVFSAILVAGPLWAEPVVDRWPLSSWVGRLKETAPPARVFQGATSLRSYREQDPRAKACFAIARLGAEAAPAIPVLIDLVHGGSDECANAAMGALAAIGRQSVPVLIELLGDDKPRSRRGAALGLGMIGPPAHAAVQPLSKLLNDAKPEVRVEAAQALWRISRNNGGVRVLAEGMSSRDHQLRIQCAQVIAEMGPAAKSAVPALIQTLTDPSLLKAQSGQVVLAACADAVANIGNDARRAIPALKALLLTREIKEAQNRTRANLTKAVLKLDPGAGEIIRADIQDLGGTLNAFQLRQLGAHAVPALIETLEDTNPVIRTFAVDALGHMPNLPQESLARLRRIAESCDDINVRAAAAFGLIRAGERLDDPVLLFLCQPAVLLSVSYEADLLGQGLVRSKSMVVPVLTKYLADSDPGKRAFGAEVLARMGPAARAAAPALRRIIKEEPERLPDAAEWPARTWAAVALINMGEPAADYLPLLIQSFVATYNSQFDSRRPAIKAALVRSARLEGAAILTSVVDLLSAGREPDNSAATDLLLHLHNEKAAPVVGALSHAVLTGNDNVRKEAVELLGKIGKDSPEAVAAIHAALSDPEPAVRVRAARALWRFEHNAAVVLPILREALNDPAHRAEALEGLCELGPAAAPALDDIVACFPEPQLAGAACDLEAFFRIVPEAVPALLNLLDHRDPEVAGRAAEALGDFGPAAVRPLAQFVLGSRGRARQLAVEALRAQGPNARAALPVLRPLLHDFDRPTRFSAALAAWEIGSETKDTLPILLHGLARLTPEDRQRAAKAIGEMGERAEGTAPALEAALWDDYPEVRAAAALALAHVPNGIKSLPALIRTSRIDFSADVRSESIVALQNLAFKDKSVALSVRDHLVERLADKEWQVRYRAAQAIYCLDDLAPVSTGFLIESLDDADLQRFAWGILISRGKMVIPDLRLALAHRRPAVRRAAAEVLGGMQGAETALADLVGAMSSPDADLRLAAIQAMGKIGPAAKAAAPALRVALNDDNANVCAAARIVLDAMEAKDTQVPVSPPSSGL